jgi:UPF0716 family protein affecting phage T7 exclusion
VSLLFIAPGLMTMGLGIALMAPIVVLQFSRSKAVTEREVQKAD